MSASLINLSHIPKPIVVDIFFPKENGRGKVNAGCDYQYLSIISLCVPIFGNILAVLARECENGEVPDEEVAKGTKFPEKYSSYVNTEIAKCERMGALILMIAGIVLLALMPQGGQNFAIAGGTLLGVGTLEFAYLTYRIEINTEKGFCDWVKMFHKRGRDHEYFYPKHS